MVYNFVLIAS